MKITTGLEENGKDQPKKKRKFLFLRLKNLFPYLGLLAGILLFVFHQSLLTYSEKIVGEIIINFLRYETRGEYTIEYEKVRLNVFRQELYLSDIQFRTDSSRLKLSNKKNDLDFDADMLLVNIQNLYTFLIHKEIELEKLELRRPTLQIMVDQRFQKPSKQKNKQSFVDVVSHYLDLLQIDQLSITNATIDYAEVFQDTTFRISLGDISVHITQLGLDEIEGSSTRSIVSQGIEIELLNEKLDVFPGHHIAFDRMYVNSRDSSLTIKELTIVPISNVGPNSINLSLPEIQLREFDFLGILRKERLDIGTMDFGTGQVVLKTGYGKSGKKRNNKPADMKGISAIYIDRIETKNTNVTITFPLKNGQNQTIKISDMDLGIDNVQIDSMVLSNPSRLVENGDYLLKIGTCEANLEGINHTVELNGITNAFKEGLLSFEAMHVTPNTRWQKNRITISTAKTSIQGLNYPSAILDGYLIGEQAIFNNPNIRINFVKVAKKESGPIEETSNTASYRNIYPLISNIFPQIDLNAIHINNASVFIKEDRKPVLVEGNNLNLVLSNILIDSNTVNNPYQFLGIEDIFIEGKELHSGSPDGRDEVKVDLLRFDSKSGDLTVNDIEFVSRSEFVDDFIISDVKMRGLDWLAAIYDDKILIDSVTILKPTLASSSDTLYIPTDSLIISSTPYFPDSIKVGSVRLIDGKVKLDEYGESIALLSGLNSEVIEFSVIKSDPYILWNTEYIEITNGPFSFSFPDDSHTLVGDSLYFSKTDSVLRIKQLEIRPTNTINGSYLADITIPEIRLSEFITAQFLDSGYLEIADIILDEPQIDLVLSPQPEKEIQQEQKDSKLKSHFLINRFLIKNGSIEFEYADSLGHTISSDEISLSISGITIDSLTKFDNALSFMDYFDFQAKNIHYEGIEDLDSAFIGLLELNSDSYLKTQNIVVDVLDSLSTFETVISEISIYGKDWVRKIAKKEYLFDSLVVDHPEVVIALLDTTSEKEIEFNIRNLRNTGFTGREDVTEKTGIIESNEPQSLSKEEISSSKFPLKDSIWITNLKILSGKFHFDNKGKTYLIPHVDILVENLNLSEDNSNPMYAENFIFRATNVSDILNSDLNDVRIDGLIVSTKEKRLQLNGFHFKPKVEKMEYGWEVGHQTDWMNIETNAISMNGLDFDKLMEGELRIEEIFVDSTEIYVFRDKHVPFPTDQRRYMPQKMISDLPIPMNIESVIINHANITYEELDSEADSSGYISFENLTGGIQNITNDSIQLLENNVMQVAASTEIMGLANLQTEMEFDLTDADYQHKYQGFLSAMDLTALNSILEPNVRIHIKNGQLKKMDFSAEGDDYYTTGEMEMLYNDLHVNLISKKRGTTSAMGPALGSFFANTFFINRNNPRLIFARNGDIYAERDSSKSIFNYMSKTALSGIISNIGAKNNRKEIKKANKAAQEKKDTKKKKEKHKRRKEDDAYISSNEEKN